MEKIKDLLENSWEFNLMIILSLPLIVLIIICILYHKQLLVSYKCVQSHTEEKERTICHRDFGWSYICETEKYYEEVCDKYEEVGE